MKLGLVELAIAIAAVILAACESLEIQPPDSRHFSFEITDNPTEKRFDLKFTSKTHLDLCLAPEMWPGVSGAIDHSGGFIYVEVNNKKFPLKDINRGFCVWEGCYERVSFSKEIRAFLKYDDFKLSTSEYQAEKILFFTPRPWWCASL